MSKEKLLLVGAGGFGRMVAEQAMLQYDCAFVDDGQPVGTEICGIPVVGSLADLPELRKEYGLLVVGIGNKSSWLCFSQYRCSQRLYQSAFQDGMRLCGAAKRLHPEWCICRKRCSAECRNGNPL